MSIDPLQDPCNGICKLEKDLEGFKWMHVVVVTRTNNMSVLDL